MTAGIDMATVGALIGDPGRANMLAALADGRALTATELASVAGVTAATASGHLAKLTQGGLLAVTSRGRHRYFRLASGEVASMLESMMLVAAASATPRRRANRTARARWANPPAGAGRRPSSRRRSG